MDWWRLLEAIGLVIAGIVLVVLFLELLFRWPGVVAVVAVLGALGAAVWSVYSFLG